MPVSAKVRAAQFCSLLFCIVLGATSCNGRSRPNAEPTDQPTPKIATKTPQKPVEAPPVWKKIEEVNYNWNGRGPVKLVAELDEPTSDPGDFRRIRIHVPGEQEFILTNEDGWVAYDGPDSLLGKSDLTKKLVESSRRELLSRYFMTAKVAPNRAVLLLLSMGYASDPARLHVVELPSSGPPKVVFNDLFEITDLDDLDRDSVGELIGLPCYSQVWGLEDGSVTTYDPIHVLHFSSNKGERMKLSVPLSKSYNELRRGVWAGPDCSEEIAVYSPKEGKRRIVTKAEVEKLAQAETKR